MDIDTFSIMLFPFISYVFLLAGCAVDQIGSARPFQLTRPACFWWVVATELFATAMVASAVELATLVRSHSG